MADDRRVLYEIKRNSTETLRVSLSTFKGRTYVDIRLFFESDDADDLQPTKKGVTVTPELWDEFHKAVDAADAILQEKNLWHPASAETGGEG